MSNRLPLSAASAAGLTLMITLFAACAAPTGQPESDGEESTGEAEAAMTGFPIAPTAGIVKISVPGVGFRTGVLVTPTRVLTGLAAIPGSTAVSSLTVVPPGQPNALVSSRFDNSTLGVTLLVLSSSVAGPIWPLNTASPSTYQGHTATCPGYDTAGTSLRALGVFGAPTSSGYQMTFTTGSIADSDDGVPCYDDINPALGITGIALSTSGSVHQQVSAARLAPWLADPIPKTLTLTRTRYHAGTGTISAPSALTTCNSGAYGSSCSASFTSLSSVVITTSPGAGSITQWTGCTSASGNSCTVNMNAAKSVTAKFVGCADCYDDCVDTCTNFGGPGGLPMSVCVPQCVASCKGCGL